ncbi:MAG: RNA polymerase sigma factor [Planctomycetes bacterium]|nr:RNA polymerase sigma factor [Planctomycetota bacterium]
MDLDKLISHFRGPLTGLIASWGLSPGDAVEICMDTFAEAYLGKDRFRGDWNELASTGAWLRGIAYNLFRTHRRGSLRPTEPMGDRDFAEPEGPDEPQDDSRVSQVRKAMALLKGEHRSVLFMRYVESSGPAEIAALMGLTERAVEGRLYRARKALEEQMKYTAQREGATVEPSQGVQDHE